VDSAAHARGAFELIAEEQQAEQEERKLIETKCAGMRAGAWNYGYQLRMSLSAA
jgi:hypothetical protein